MARRKKSGIESVTNSRSGREVKHASFNDALAEAARTSFELGKYSNVYVLVHSEQDALNWGGHEAVEAYWRDADNSSTHPTHILASIPVKAGPYSLY